MYQISAERYYDWGGPGGGEEGGRGSHRGRGSCSVSSVPYTPRVAIWHESKLRLRFIHVSRHLYRSIFFTMLLWRMLRQTHFRLPWRRRESVCQVNTASHTIPRIFCNVTVPGTPIKSPSVNTSMDVFLRHAPQNTPRAYFIEFVLC